MCFHFLNFSQCAFLGIKQSTKLQISKSTLKGDILGAIPFQQRRLIWTTELFSCICDITKINPAFFEWWGGGGGCEENAWLITARFRIETQCGCFYITVFLMETNSFLKILDVNLISSCI